MARHSDIVRDQNEVPIVGALIAVKNQDGTTPVLTDDSGQVLRNPLTSDSYGAYYFNALANFYDEEYFYGGRLIRKNYGVTVGVVTLPTGFIADALGNSTTVAPSQRAVSAAITQVLADATAAASGYATDAADSAADAEEALAAISAELTTASIYTRAAKALDTSITSSTTLVADPDLVVPLGINSHTLLRGRVNYSASAAGDFKWRHAGPASPAAIQINRKAIAPGASALSGIAIDTAYSSADIPIDGGTGSGAIEFEATIINGSTAGNFTIPWAQNTSDATATIVKAGSYIEYTALPISFNVAWSNNGIAKLGGFTATTSGGHNFQAAIGPAALGQSHIEFVATGTDLTAQLFTGNYTVTVDGGAPFTVSGPGGSTWGFVSVFAGLSDGAHSVTMNGLYFENDITLRVKGLAPNVTRPSNIPNYYPIGQYAAYVATEGRTATQAVAGFAYVEEAWSVGNGFGLRFQATTTSVRIYHAWTGGAGHLALWQDGVQIGSDITPANAFGLYSVVTLATGLSGTHEYEIKTASADKSCFIYAILVDTLETVAHTAKALDAHYGDSIVVQLAGSDARDSDAYKASVSTSRSCVKLGAGGTQMSTYGRDNTALVTGLPQVPTRVHVRFGTNDAFAGVALATFQADTQTCLTALRTGLPSAKIYVWGILNTTRVSTTVRNNYNAKLSAAVTAMADANIVYLNTDGWIDPVSPSTDTLDGLHPSPTGYTKIAAALVPVL